MEQQTEQMNKDQSPEEQQSQEQAQPSAQQAEEQPAQEQKQEEQAASSEASSAGPVSKDMTIGEIVGTYPPAAQVLMEAGIHCVGCGAANWETLEQGLTGHGKTPEEIEKVVNDINAFIKLNPAPQQQAAATQAPAQPAAAPTTPEQAQEQQTPSAAPAQQSQELVITEKAASKVKEILDKEGKEGFGLRIRVVPGGCSGFQYAMEFDKKQDSDNVTSVGGVDFYVDAQSMEFLKGAHVDFVETLNESGFKIENPNAAGGCGCGKSFH